MAGESIRPRFFIHRNTVLVFQDGVGWWTIQDSNLWPLPCQGNALAN